MLGTALFWIFYHKKAAPAYVPVELSLNAVHVHHFSEKAASLPKKSVSEIPLPSRKSSPEPAPAASPAPASDTHEGGGPQAIDDAVSRYLSQVLQIISRQKFYPKASLLNEESGTVETRLTLDAGGALVRAEVKKSSGFPNLDAAAMKTLQSISSFPPPPSGLATPLNLIVPIRYELNSDER